MGVSVRAPFRSLNRTSNAATNTQRGRCIKIMDIRAWSFGHWTPTLIETNRPDRFSIAAEYVLSTYVEVVKFTLT